MSTAGALPVESPRAREILDRATELFHSHGYHAVGMRMIAGEVGIQTAGLYHHFPSKEEILYRICIEVTKTYVDEHMSILYGSDPAPARLKRLIRRHITYFWRHRLAMDVALRDHRSMNAEHFEEVRSHRRRYQEALQTFIAEGVKNGDLSVPDPRIAAIALLDMINGINGWFDPDGPSTIDSLAEHYADLVVDQLLGATSASNPKGRKRS